MLRKIPFKLSIALLFVLAPVVMHSAQLPQQGAGMAILKGFMDNAGRDRISTFDRSVGRVDLDVEGLFLLDNQNVQLGMQKRINLVKQVKAVRDCRLENHPLVKTKNLDLLYGLAQRVSVAADESFPAKNQVILGLGQSPAYLLEMMKCIDQENNRNDRVHKHVAFSHEWRSTFLIERGFRQRKSAYEEYLNNSELAPDDLNKEDTNFVILDFAVTGRGLKSFLAFFENYKKKPSVVYWQNADSEAPMLSVASHKLGLNPAEDELMPHLGSLDKLDDRLVAYFPHYEWSTVNPLDFRPGENAQVILNYVQQYAKYKSQFKQC